MTITNEATWETDLKRYAEKAGWTPDTSNIIGYFPDNLPGYRCLWTCRWITNHGLVTVADMGMELENMPIEYIWAELDDLGCRGDDFALELVRNIDDYSEIKDREEEFYVKLRESIEAWFDAHKEKIFSFLTNRRYSYPEFMALWDRPKNVQNLRLHPGFALRGMKR